MISYLFENYFFLPPETKKAESHCRLLSVTNQSGCQKENLYNNHSRQTKDLEIELFKDQVPLKSDQMSAYIS
jgi:hypothetical protein